MMVETEKYLITTECSLLELLPPLDQLDALYGVLLRHLDRAMDPDKGQLQPMYLLVTDYLSVEVLQELEPQQ
jgi:hypothetical protein